MGKLVSQLNMVNDWDNKMIAGKLSNRGNALLCSKSVCKHKCPDPKTCLNAPKRYKMMDDDDCDDDLLSQKPLPFLFDISTNSVFELVRDNCPTRGM